MFFNYGILGCFNGFGDAKVTWHSGDMNGLYTREHRVPWGFSHSFTFSYRFDLRWLDWMWLWLIVIHQVIPWTHNPCSRTWLHWLAHVFSECSRRCEAEHWSTDWMGDLMEEFMAHVNNVSNLHNHQQFIIFVSDFGRFWPLAGDNPPILGSDWSGQGSRPLHGVIPGAVVACCSQVVIHAFEAVADTGGQSSENI